MSRPQDSLSLWCCAVSFKCGESSPKHKAACTVSWTLSFSGRNRRGEWKRGFLSSSHAVHSQVVEICRNVTHVPLTPLMVWLFLNGRKDRSSCLMTKFCKLCSDRGSCEHWQHTDGLLLMFHPGALWRNTLCRLYRAKLISLNTDLPVSFFFFFSGSGTKLFCSASTKIWHRFKIVSNSKAWAIC